MKEWNAGTIVWFVLMILGCGSMFIEYVLELSTATNSAYQQATVIYGIVGAVYTALYLWLWISRRKAALVTILVIAGLNAAVTLFTSGFGSALISLITPTLTWLFTHNTVEANEAALSGQTSDQKYI